MLAHLSLFLNDTPIGEALGLHFPSDKVASRIPSIFAHNFCSSPLTLSLKHFESTVVRVEGYTPSETIHIAVDPPQSIYVVVVTW